MKKIIVIMLMGALLALSTGVGFADDYKVLANDPVRIMVDGNEVLSFDTEQKVDLPAVIVNGRTMMPLKRTFQLFDAQVSWNGVDRSITSTNSKGETIWVQIDNAVAKIDDREITLDAAPMIFENRTFVPLAFVSEAMGVKPDWDGVNRIVFLNVNSIKGVALPQMIAGQYFGVYEENDKINYYYDLSNRLKSIEIKEEKNSINDVLLRYCDELGVQASNFAQKDIKNSLIYSYTNSERAIVYYVIFEESDSVYSIIFSDFKYDEVMDIVSKL